MSPSTAFLSRIASFPALRADSWYLIAAATSTALGEGHSWIPALYRHAASLAGPAPSSFPKISPPNFADDTLPSRRVVRRIKEALFKSAILVGVPRVIEASFALKVATEGTPDFDTSFTRDGIDNASDGVDGPNRNKQRGLIGLERVYRKQYGPISSKMGPGMREIQWMSENITYGLFLEPVSESSASAPLSFAETEMVVLSCLIAHRAKREVLWHLRGTLRSGLSAEEVEAVQQVIELVAGEIGVDVKDMPRVGEVTEDDDLSGI